MTTPSAFAIRNRTGAWLSRSGRWGAAWAARLYSSPDKAASALRQLSTPAPDAVVVAVSIVDCS